MPWMAAAAPAAAAAGTGAAAAGGTAAGLGTIGAGTAFGSALPAIGATGAGMGAGAAGAGGAAAGGGMLANMGNMLNAGVSLRQLMGSGKQGQQVEAPPAAIPMSQKQPIEVSPSASTAVTRLPPFSFARGGSDRLRSMGY